MLKHVGIILHMAVICTASPAWAEDWFDPKGQEQRAALGDPTGIMFMNGLGTDNWDQVQDLADQGYAEAFKKVVGYSYFIQRRAGETDAAAFLPAMEAAAQTISDSELAAMAAMGRAGMDMPEAWHAVGVPALAAAAEKDDRIAELACRLAAPTGTMIRGDLARFCMPSAAKGSAPAHAVLGMLFLARPDDFVRGLERWIEPNAGIKRNPAQARKHYEAAARAGRADAQARLAWMQACGRGGAENPVEARTWAERAALAGNAEGKSVLGLMIAAGLGGAADQSRAVELLTQAARSGDRPAQLALAAFAFRGQGRPRDFLEALTWLRLSEISERGDIPAADIAPLMPASFDHIRDIAARTANPELDLQARARAAALRRELAAGGEWPLVDHFRDSGSHSPAKPR